MSTPQRDASSFQGSETTGVEVRFYPQRGDPVTYEATPFALDGRRRSDEESSVIAVSTSKAMGAASGKWSVTLKPGQRELRDGLFKRLMDDDWVDITWIQNGRPWHAMRGLVDDPRRRRAVGGSGATTQVYTVTGRDFGKIWEITPIWFSPYSSVSLSGALSHEVFGASAATAGPPQKVVNGFLFGMLKAIANHGRENWTMPPGMPPESRTFIDTVAWDDRDFDPQRFADPNNPGELGAIGANWLMPSGNLWDLAKGWSDPIFNELWSDILRFDTSINSYPGEALVPSDSEPTVFFRGRPFPTLEEGKESPWFNLLTHVLPVEHITESDVGRSGAERYNAFFASPQVTQEATGDGGLDLIAPLWSSEDISRHGLRRFDIVSKYTSTVADLLGVSRRQRTVVRDWYCMNPYLLSGTIQARVSRPRARIGHRLLIPGRLSKKDDETYYIESVSHNWSPGRGLRTNFGVTRGWIGTDDAYLDLLQNLALEYKEAPIAKAGEPPSVASSFTFGGGIFEDGS